MIKYRSVYVKWMDAWGDDDWLDVEDLKTKSAEHYIVHTIGYLIAENAMCYIVAQNVEEVGDMASMTMFIPREMVLSITDLTLPEKS